MSPKKTIKTKNKRSSKKTLARVQKNNPKEVWSCMLYLRGNRSNLVKLANRASACEGITWGISQIRPESSPTTMLQMQYKYGGKWGDFYRKYETLGGERLCGQNLGGQKNNTQGIRLVRAVITHL